MAEAHSAVAFSFHVTPEGLDVKYNHEAIRAVWHSGLRSWKLRMIRFKNHLVNTLYPAPPISLFLICVLVTVAQLYSGADLSYGMVDTVSTFFPECVHDQCEMITALVFGFAVWVAYVLLRRYSLKLLLMNHSWMYEPFGKISLPNKIWFGLVKLLQGRDPLLYGYQSALPKLPVPSLQGTKSRYLASIRPLVSDEEYKTLSGLADEFFGGIGNKLQWYLHLKSWWATNYVTDWWEQYVYLMGRSPIMVNSNYYGIDAIFNKDTSLNQAARAGNMVYAFLQFKEKVEHEALQPLMVNKTVPLCSTQYERIFNLARIPGEETDTLVQAHGQNYIVVYNRGRYFKVYTHSRGHPLSPRDLQYVFQQILNDVSVPCKGEEKLAALTAGERTPWAKARKQFFSSGVNKASLDAIEKSSFVLILDDEENGHDPEDPSKLDNYARAMLHGKCYDRWFDKSFNLIVTSNGRVGFNAEHSWADAPIMSQIWEYSFHYDYSKYGADAPILMAMGEYAHGFENHNPYDEDGNCKGEVSDVVTSNLFQPIKMQWNISEACQEVIESSLRTAQALANDVDLHLTPLRDFGKGIMKKCKVSPDAFIQLALQLAYYRDAGKFCLTYEASMTRFFREGRTETVRSCTNESSVFVMAMDSGKETKEELRRLLKVASERHQKSYKDAMTGAGIDRHLFCLYVVSKYLGIESPFLQKVLSEPWRLSTSQTPHSQLNVVDVAANPDLVCGGGGFGPVSDDGYGVSYIVAGEDTLFFHISSKKSCPGTDSKRFTERVLKALGDLRELCGQ